MRLVRFFTADRADPHRPRGGVCDDHPQLRASKDWFSDRVRERRRHDRLDAARRLPTRSIWVTLADRRARARQVPERPEGALPAAVRRRAARPAHPWPAADAARAAERPTSSTAMATCGPAAERSYLFWYKPPSADDIARARNGDVVVTPGLGERRSSGPCCSSTPSPTTFSMSAATVDRHHPEPARRHAGDRALLPAARGRPRAAVVRVRADLPRLRAGGDPARRSGWGCGSPRAGPAGRPPRCRRRPGRPGRSRRAGARRVAATTRSRCSAGPSTR